MVCLLRDDVRNMISPTRISGRGKASGVYKALMKWPKWNKGLVVIGWCKVRCPNTITSMVCGCDEKTLEALLAMAPHSWIIEAGCVNLSLLTACIGTRISMLESQITRCADTWTILAHIVMHSNIKIPWSRGILTDWSVRHHRLISILRLLWALHSCDSYW